MYRLKENIFQQSITYFFHLIVFFTLKFNILTQQTETNQQNPYEMVQNICYFYIIIFVIL